MNKHKFIHILQNFNNIPEDDRDRLHELAKNYPYSQILHILIAKAHTDAKTRIADQTLTYAAMYATDRTTLKKIIHSKENGVPAQSKLNGHQPIAKETAQKSLVQEADQLRKEIWIDLAALKKSKAAYMAWFETQSELSESTNEPSPNTDEPSPITDDDQLTAAKPPERPVKKTAKKTVTKKPGKAAASQASPDSWQLIENFISKEPSITSKPIMSSENQPDLSETSTAFNEDLVSENLALIFINQNKKEKAIDIYKKLIWKFPQKKTYFASLIEELQK